VNGAIIPNEDVGALAAALRELTSNHALRRAQATASAAAARRWTIEEGAKRWRDAVAKVMPVAQT
jgi:glycosyltransferase involved in cell wall biosynthesis